jgi:hypothetical protein
MDADQITASSAPGLAQERYFEHKDRPGMHRGARHEHVIRSERVFARATNLTIFRDQLPSVLRRPAPLRYINPSLEQFWLRQNEVVHPKGPTVPGESPAEILSGIVVCNAPNPRLMQDKNMVCPGLVARSPTRLISVTACSLEDAVYAAQVQR